MGCAHYWLLPSQGSLENRKVCRECGLRRKFDSTPVDQIPMRRFPPRKPNPSMYGPQGKAGRPRK